MGGSEGIVMDAAALAVFLARDFPEVSGRFQVEAVSPERLLLRLRVAAGNLRPGGTLSGATIFELADMAVYLAILSRIGPQALTVTTGASIDYLRKPPGGADLLGEARLLKLGQRLAVGDVLIRSEAGPQIIARASLTFSIPPR
jgi:uncharacterized protein (TIGR00369 family)